jgi:hypothetical protein
MPNAFRSKKWKVVWRQLLQGANMQPPTYFRFQYLAYSPPVFQQPQKGLAFSHFTVHKLHQTSVRYTTHLILIIRLEMELISLVWICITLSAVLVFGVKLRCVFPLFHFGMPCSHHLQCEWCRRKMWLAVYSKGGGMALVVNHRLHSVALLPRWCLCMGP